MTSRKTSYSPMQRFRRSTSQEDVVHTFQVTFKITLETIPAYDVVKDRIYPITKQWAWIKKARDAFFLCNENKPLLLHKSMSNINLGFVYAYNVGDELHYITSLHLTAWALTEKWMRQHAVNNLIKYIDQIERPLFTKMQIGIYYCTKLNLLTSSLFCVPHIFEELSLATVNLVLMCPVPNLMLICQSNDQKSLTFMGEMKLKYSQNSSNQPITNKPIRCVKNNLSLYEATIRGEYLVPSTLEQLQISKNIALKIK